MGQIEQSKEGFVSNTIDFSPVPSLFADENARIPSELNARSKVYELRTIGDARQALARLRQLRRDFDTNVERSRTVRTRPTQFPLEVSGNGEEMLAGLSNIQRMRTIRNEIAYLEDLMVRIAEREFQLEEVRHRSYLSGIGQWSERNGQRPVI